MKAHSEFSELSVFESMTKTELLQSCYGRDLCKSWTKAKMLERIAHKTRVAILSASAQSVYRGEGCYPNQKPDVIEQRPEQSEVCGSWKTSVGKEYGLIAADEELTIVDCTSETYQREYFKALEVCLTDPDYLFYWNSDNPKPIDFNISGWYDGYTDYQKGVSRWSDVSIKKLDDKPVKSFAFFYEYTHDVLRKVVRWLVVHFWDCSYDLPQHIFKGFWNALINWQLHCCGCEYWFWSKDKSAAIYAEWEFKKNLEIVIGYLNQSEINVQSILNA